MPSEGGGSSEASRRRCPDEVVANAFECRVERVRALDVRLGEVLLVLGDVDVEACAGDDPAALDCVLARLSQCDERVVLLVVGEVEARDPAGELEPHLWVDIGETVDVKRRMLAAPASQVGLMKQVYGEDLLEMVERLGRYRGGQRGSGEVGR